MLEETKGKISEELERLGHELNVTLPAAILRAVEHGDLRENAEYKSALDRQQFVQARIQHLTQRMGELSRIDVASIPEDRVGFGSRLRLRNLATGEELTHTIGAGDFLDLEAGHVSMASPLGRALLGRRLDEEVIVVLPGGERRFRIIELTTLRQMLG